MAGTVTTTLTKIDNVMELTFAWTADASAATVPATAVPTHMVKSIKGLSCVLGTTNPGSTAPTDGYKVTVTDSDGIDIFGGAMWARSATASEQAAPVLNGNAVKRVTNGALTLNISDNLVNSATGTVKLYFSN